MLEQYRKDFPVEENDLLPEGESMSRRKLLFIITGIAFALVFFLFLMGLFRSDTDSLAIGSESADKPAKEILSSLEERLQSALARIEKLEHETIGKVALPVQPDNALAAQPFATTQDAASMADQAIRHFISKTATDTQVEAVYAHAAPAPAPKVTKKETAKAPVKAKKAAKADLSVGTNSPTYVVQKGDTLSKISQRYFGTPHRWRAIYDANRDRINNLNNLKVGTALVIPVETPKIGNTQDRAIAVDARH